MDRLGEFTHTSAQSGAERFKLRGLVLNLGEGARRISLDSQRIRIGSHRDNDVVVSESRVSRFHAEIIAEENGFCWRDLGSKNGTWIHGVRVNEFILTPGLAVSLGGVRVVIEAEEKDVEFLLSTRERLGDLVGRSRPMREVFGIAERCARTTLPVVICGEEGVGRSALARAVHDLGGRKSQPYVELSVRALNPEQLLNELNPRRTDSAWRRASSGTLVIDELERLPLEAQELLSVRLQEAEEGRLSLGPEPPRLIAITRTKLSVLRSADGLDAKLLSHLEAMEIHVPPLRERTEDIPLLAELFLGDVRSRLGQPQLTIAWQTMQRLLKHHWHGNVRELRNFVERAAVLSGGSGEVQSRFLREVEVSLPLSVDTDKPFKLAKQELIEAFERAYWTELLRRCGGNTSEAARRAGIHRKSAEYILKKL